MAHNADISSGFGIIVTDWISSVPVIIPIFVLLAYWKSSRYMTLVTKVQFPTKISDFKNLTSNPCKIKYFLNGALDAGFK